MNVFLFYSVVKLFKYFCTIIVNIVKMNFNQRRAELRKGNIMLTIAKGNGKNILPSYSNYKREYSKGNSDVVTQLYFDFLDDGKIKSLPYYGLIVYEIDNYELKDLNIIIPNSGFTSILDIIHIEFDKNIYMNINGVDREKLKQSVMNEIINNPKIIDNY